MDTKELNDTFKRAEHYHYAKNDYASAFKEYKKIAIENFGPAMRKIAQYYEEGKGVEKSVLHALYWRKRIADLTDAAIDHYLLGQLWFNEKDALKNTYTGENADADSEAIKSFTVACEKGYSMAFFKLGCCYEQAENYEKSAECYKQATEKNVKDAPYKLGMFYFYGRGVEKNHVLAFENFKKAVELGCKEANGMLGYCYEAGIGTEIDNEKAVGCYLIASELGNDFAQYNLACCYKNGKGIEKNLTEAVKWYKLSAEQGNMYAQYALAYRYLNGEGVPKSEEEYQNWMIKSAVAGNVNAQYSLGCDYFESTNGLPKNVEKAELFLKRPAQSGNARAQLMLGKIYKKGGAVPKNKKRAFELFESASSNLPEAKYELALCYFNADGTKKKYYKAIRLLEEASEQGVSKATVFLEKTDEYEIKRAKIKQSNYETILAILDNLYSTNPNSFYIPIFEQLILKRKKRGILRSWDKLDITVKKIKDANKND